MIGKIIKLRAWKNCGGFFVGIEGKENDYLYNGSCKAKLGDVVNFEEGRPTSDGKPTLKRGSVVPVPTEAHIDEDKPRSATLPPYREHDWKDEVDARRVKIRLECLRIAVDAGAVEPIEKARQYEKYVRE